MAEQSILKSVKKVLNIHSEDDAFDPDVIMHINSVFFTLNQLGIGLSTGFSIEGSEEKWSDFVQSQDLLNGVKTYVYLRVRLLFDPPTTSFAQEAIQKQITELEWRLNVNREEVLHPWTSPQQPSSLTTE